MPYPLKPQTDRWPLRPRLWQIQADAVYRRLERMGFIIPEDATIEFQHDVTPLEIDITSWHPVIVREETFRPMPDPWVTFQKV